MSNLAFSCQNLANMVLGMDPKVPRGGDIALKGITDHVNILRSLGVFIGAV